MNLDRSADIHFRCDAGSRFGLGHLMRCVALAQGFRRAVVNRLIFLIRDLAETRTYRRMLTDLGFHSILLPESAVGLDISPDVFGSASDSSLIVFDSYDVTEFQMRALRKRHASLIAIDDMADRTFVADVIINPNINAETFSYRTEKSTELMLGKDYVLLRESVLYGRSTDVRVPSRLPRIFMSFGGGDIYARIRPLFNALRRLDERLESALEIDFAMVNDLGSNRCIQAELAGLSRIRVNWILGRFDLSQIMNRADFAVTAGGSVVFELAYLGIPQMVVIIDKNQEQTGINVDGAGIGRCLGSIERVSEKQFIRMMFEFLNDDRITAAMSRKGREYIDGKGVNRVVQRITQRYGLPAACDRRSNALGDGR